MVNSFSAFVSLRMRPLTVSKSAADRLRASVTVCSLALFGLSRLKEIAEVRQLFCLGIGGLFLSLGGYGLLHGILYSLAPLVEKARNVAAAIFLFQLAAAVLAAFGIDSFPAAERWVKYVSRALLAIVAFVAGVMLLFALTLKTDLHPLITVSAFYALLLALVIRSWRSGFLGRGLAVAALITLFLSDHANARFFSFSDKFGEERQKRVKALSENTDIVDYLRRFLHDGRVDYDSKLIPYNIGDWHGIETYGAYLASVTDNILRHEFPNPRVYDLFGVRFLIRDEPSRPDQELVFTSATGIKVYRNPNAFRRHWTVHRVVGVRDAKEVNSHLFDAKFDPRQTALVVGEAPALETCPGADELVVLSRTPNTVVLAVQMACRGMLIVADTYFPGWEATVDGRPVRIHEAYDMIRGIVVDAGPHRVEMRYRPWSVRLGALLTGLATLAACAAWWRSRRG